MRPTPYIGITGFMHAAEIEETLSVLVRPKHEVMIGALVSTETLRGEANKWPKRYPLKADLQSVFGFEPSEGVRAVRTLNLLHFKTKDTSTLYRDMMEAQAAAGPYCMGFQLNIAWPDLEVLKQYRKVVAVLKRRKIVLQCGSKALEQVDNDPLKLAERVSHYQDYIDYVLIDPSGGLGVEFNVEAAMRYFDKLSRFKNIGFGIAGGLSAHTVDKIEPILREFPGMISIDAEGRLRDKNDDLSIVETKAYLARASELYRRYEPQAA